MNYDSYQYDGAGDVADNSDAYYRVGMEYIDLENVIGAQQAGGAGGGGAVVDAALLQQQAMVHAAGGGDPTNMATETYAV